MIFPIPTTLAAIFTFAYGFVLATLTVVLFVRNPRGGVRVSVRSNHFRVFGVFLLLAGVAFALPFQHYVLARTGVEDVDFYVGLAQIHPATGRLYDSALGASMVGFLVGTFVTIAGSFDRVEDVSRTLWYAVVGAALVGVGAIAAVGLLWLSV